MNPIKQKRMMDMEEAERGGKAPDRIRRNKKAVLKEKNHITKTKVSNLSFPKRKGCLSKVETISFNSETR